MGGSGSPNGTQTAAKGLSRRRSHPAAICTRAQRWTPPSGAGCVDGMRCSHAVERERGPDTAARGRTLNARRSETEAHAEGCTARDPVEGKCPEPANPRTESGFVDGDRERLLVGTGAPFGGGENVLESDGGEHGECRWASWGAPGLGVGAAETPPFPMEPVLGAVTEGCERPEGGRESL